jgi:hypothetical protein
VLSSASRCSRMPSPVPRSQPHDEASRHHPHARRFARAFRVRVDGRRGRRAVAGRTPSRARAVHARETARRRGAGACERRRPATLACRHARHVRAHARPAATRAARGRRAGHAARAAGARGRPSHGQAGARAARTLHGGARAPPRRAAREGRDAQFARDARHGPAAAHGNRRRPRTFADPRRRPVRALDHAGGPRPSARRSPPDSRARSHRLRRGPSAAIRDSPARSSGRHAPDLLRRLRIPVRRPSAGMHVHARHLPDGAPGRAFATSPHGANPMLPCGALEGSGRMHHSPFGGFGT